MNFVSASSRILNCSGLKYNFSRIIYSPNILERTIYFLDKIMNQDLADCHWDQSYYLYVPYMAKQGIILWWAPVCTALMSAEQNAPIFWSLAYMYHEYSLANSEVDIEKILRLSLCIWTEECCFIMRRPLLKSPLFVRIFYTAIYDSPNILHGWLVVKLLFILSSMFPMHWVLFWLVC